MRSSQLDAVAAVLDICYALLCTPFNSLALLATSTRPSLYHSLSLCVVTYGIGVSTLTSARLRFSSVSMCVFVCVYI